MKTDPAIHIRNLIDSAADWPTLMQAWLEHAQTIEADNPETFEELAGELATIRNTLGLSDEVYGA